MDWNKYIGELVSVLIIGKNNKEENYIGFVEDIVDDFLILNTDDANAIISQITFKTYLIKSVWIYKPKTNKKKKVSLRDKYGLGYPVFLK